MIQEYSNKFPDLAVTSCTNLLWDVKPCWSIWSKARQRLSLLLTVKAILPTDRPHVLSCWICSSFMEPQPHLGNGNTALKVPCKKRRVYPTSEPFVLSDCSVTVNSGTITEVQFEST